MGKKKLIEPAKLYSSIFWLDWGDVNNSTQPPWCCLIMNANFSPLVSGFCSFNFGGGGIQLCMEPILKIDFQLARKRKVDDVDAFVCSRAVMFEKFQNFPTFHKQKKRQMLGGLIWLLKKTFVTNRRMKFAKVFFYEGWGSPTDT